MKHDISEAGSASVCRQGRLPYLMDPFDSAILSYWAAFSYNNISVPEEQVGDTLLRR